MVAGAPPICPSWCASARPPPSPASGVILGTVEAPNPAWVPGDCKPAPGVTDDQGELLDTVRAIGAAFTARQGGHVQQSRELMDDARAVLGHAGVQLVLALLNSGRIPYPDAALWPVLAADLP